MRKFMKGCAITALIFILLGLILGVSGSLGNGSTHFSPGEILSAVTLGRISGEEVDDWSSACSLFCFMFYNIFTNQRVRKKFQKY